MLTKKVLGIDPGYERLGIGIIEKDSTGKERLVFSTCIRTKKGEFSDRLLEIADQFEKILEKHKPNAVALETLFLTKNHKTVMHVAEVRGLLLYLARKSGSQIFEYSPTQVKSSLTGNGQATKIDVKKMLKLILPTDNLDKLDDELDAVAIALTALANIR